MGGSPQVSSWSRIKAIPGIRMEEKGQIFEKVGEFRYEQLVFCHDTVTKLRAIIAIHDTP
jgi:hypothetical protein